MANLNGNLSCKILYDIILAFCALLPYLILNNVAKPFRRGFFCDDDSIRYPIKPSTVSVNELYMVPIFLVLLTVLSTEYYRLPSMVRGRQALTQYLLTNYHILLIYAFGAMTSVSITSIAKFSIGRLRPNFLASCQPDVDCAGKDPHFYIVNYNCKNEIDDARMSFFSGHSSWAGYNGVFIAMYLQARLRSPKLVLLKSLLQSLFLYMAFYTGLSRISDYKHHPTDVGIGLLVGGLVSYCTVHWAAEGFKLITWGCLTHRQNTEDNSSLLQENNAPTSYASIDSLDH